jgi:hypothetical protein
MNLPQEKVVEEGSYRDRNGSVFYHNDTVYRGISKKALQNWKILSQTRFFEEACRRGEVVQTRHVDGLEESLPQRSKDQWAAVLWHESIPFVSYPYEWSFSALKDAALLQLRLFLDALDEEIALKDASSFNIQWRGTLPVFIDIPSFEPWTAGEPWIGYRQFCQLFLYPLLLQAYKNVSFQPWLRGRIDGIEPEEMNNLMSWRDRLRGGVLSHVFLHSRFEKAFNNRKSGVKAQLSDSGFSKALIKANVHRLERLVDGLNWGQTKSEWSNYGKGAHYSAEDKQAKECFVRKVVSSRQWPLAWDLGCNQGLYTRILAEYADTVVAMDADHLTIDRLYRKLKEEANRRILPLVINLADPPPALGWRGRERKSLIERGRPSLTLCLALIHHIVIQANIPLADFIEWLRTLGGALVIEFVTREDQMVQRLLQNKVDDYADYDQGYFEYVLQQNFRIVQKQDLHSGTRILYFAEPLS